MCQWPRKYRPNTASLVCLNGIGTGILPLLFYSRTATWFHIPAVVISIESHLLTHLPAPRSAPYNFQPFDMVLIFYAYQPSRAVGYCNICISFTISGTDEVERCLSATTWFTKQNKILEFYGLWSGLSTLHSGHAHRSPDIPPPPHFHQRPAVKTLSAPEQYQTS